MSYCNARPNIATKSPCERGIGNHISIYSILKVYLIFFINAVNIMFSQILSSFYFYFYTEVDPHGFFGEM